MKFFCTLAWSVFLMAGCSSGNFHTGDKNETLRVGLAEIDITPPEGFRLAGYFDERISTGTHDPLKAKAVFFQQGQQQIALVFCDLLGISRNVSQQARARIQQRTGIPLTNVLIAATHSHSGPLFDDVRRTYFHDEAIRKSGRDPHEKIDYSSFLIEQLVRVALQSRARAQTASLEIAIARQEGLSFNRRFQMKNGTVVFNPGQLNTNIVRVAGPIDPDVGMLLVRGKNKKLSGGLTVFAMHADTIGGTLFSADYPYFLQQTLREKLGAKYVSAFAAGTCGDINHIDVSIKTPVSGPEVSERLGRTLGKTVLAKIPAAEIISRPDLTARSETLQAPLQTVSAEQVAQARQTLSRLRDSKTDLLTKVQAVKTIDLAGKGASWPLEIQAFRLDENTAMVGLPCEIFVELGLAIKAQSPFRNTFVISICNDRLSYVPTKKAFGEGSYEVTNSRVQPGVGEQMVETAVKLLKGIKP
ncbi:MAG: hypothetical protein ABJC04_02170 [Verrucomicrobiota bacterium]